MFLFLPKIYQTELSINIPKFNTLQANVNRLLVFLSEFFLLIFTYQLNCFLLKDLITTLVIQ